MKEDHEIPCMPLTGCGASAHGSYARFEVTQKQSFYRAMRAQDMRLMEQVWLRADWVGCVHPGGALIVGWRAVRELISESTRSALGTPDRRPGPRA